MFMKWKNSGEMKTSAKIQIERENKIIIIYVNDGQWYNVPDLDFIADVEIYENDSGH